MNHDFTINLLAGGKHRCTPAWDKSRDELDRCFKVYLPLSGEAFLRDGREETALMPGFLYLISGYEIRSQRCPAAMNLLWMHFNPASRALLRRLADAPMVTAWPADDFPWAAATLARVEEMFENPGSARESRLTDAAPLALSCRMEALALHLISLVLETLGPGDDNPELERLRAPLEHMERHFRENPSLADLAARANLAPNSFHRLFRKVMGVTPFHYLEGLRMEAARRMLADPRLTIKQIADDCGYADALYFSRAFARRFAAPPTTVRKRLRVTP